MKALKGVLVTCDAAVKQILLHMNTEQHFIIQDLDDTHLVIKGEELERIRRALDVELEKNTYSFE
ncbi:hypothetical protein BOTBODRAFT_30551 [Botryobasidium botryosum FD-172 SS1]|uniref:General transcription and DNA repair factor IIH subunit TFB5 n=1 Tax=Botryobasidium botryosum (strain FD-172 SS1) TaxID=930990 RepID=A0A067MLJ0_BOTB1|nr:hypothetical protein BOTBODRAFT_30551 [Botryobasidium botryosum FD-172 SS1]